MIFSVILQFHDTEGSAAFQAALVLVLKREQAPPGTGSRHCIQPGNEVKQWKNKATAVDHTSGQTRIVSM